MSYDECRIVVISNKLYGFGINVDYGLIREDEGQVLRVEGILHKKSINVFFIKFRELIYRYYCWLTFESRSIILFLEME
jgi:hypothetical protein